MLRLRAMERVRAFGRRLVGGVAALRPRGWRDVAELALVAAAVWYIACFAWLQTDGLFDPFVTEWDARANVLPALRWHGRNLFHDDLLVDFAATQNPPLWRAIFWVGTLAVDPTMLAKWLPFALLAVVVWQAWAFGKRLGGHVAGATCAVLLVHCTFIWDRMVGGNARAFGFPLVVAFIRYAAERRERAVLVVLFLMALAYPSAFLFCAPAWGLVLLAPDETRGWLTFDARWVRLVVVGGAGAAVAAWFAFVTDPRIGHAITLEELEGVGQRGYSGLWPLPEIHVPIQRALQYSLFYATGTYKAILFDKWILRTGGALALALTATLLTAAGRRLRALPAVFPALLISSLVAFAAAQLLAYRLYFPARMLEFSWPPLLLLGLVAVGIQAFAARGRRDAVLLTVLVLGAFTFLTNGDGLERSVGLHDWRSRETPMVKKVATLPPDVVVAAHFDQANALQYLAHRKVLFSAISNIPHHYPYALELERRIRAWYLAYYARDWDTVRRFAADEHVDYMIVDVGDFGPQAYQRAKYAEPWTTFAVRLLRMGPLQNLVLQKPPDAAIVYRSGPLLLVDLHKL